jgi:hypothetical protein
MLATPLEGGLTMCYERWMRRRDREAEESRDVWRDFERTTPIADADRPAEPAEPTTAEAREEVVSAER